MRVEWTPLAEHRAAEAFAYIAAARPVAAHRWFDRLTRVTESLATLPDQGRVLSRSSDPPVREVLVLPYRVLYRTEGERVLILTIRHTRRR